MKVRLAVVDTNVLISAALLVGLVPAAAVRAVLQHRRLLFSEATFAELEAGLWRPKFDRYVSIETRNLLSHDLSAAAHWAERLALEVVPASGHSRDPTDDKFVQLAMAGHADILISGDDDLLTLRAVQGIPILTARAALRIVEGWRV